MRLGLRALAIAVVLLATAATASADSVTLTINNGGNITDGGVYVGPYNFTTSTGQSLQLICDSFSNDVYPPETWTATTATVGSNATGLNGSLNSTGYAEVAWLAQKMFANLSNTQVVADIQWAIWDIFDAGPCGTGVSNCDKYGTPSNPTGNAADPLGINGWLTAAQNNYASGNYSNVTIYTPSSGWPAGDGTPQEYIGVPEPGVVLLLGTGLAALILFRRRLAF